MDVIYGSSINGLGVQFSKSQAVSADGGTGLEVTLPAGTAGSLTTRSSATAGVVTATGHGITGTPRVDIHWDGGVLYDAVVSGVNGTAVTFTGGTGTLPAQATAVVICQTVLIELTIDGDNLQLFAICAHYASAAATNGVSFATEDSSDVAIDQQLIYANKPRIFHVAAGDTNPYASAAVAHCYASNGGTAACTLQIVSLVDANP